MSAIWESLWRAETLWRILVIAYVPTCAALIGIVLLQKGKGVGFAGAFGLGPGSDAVFGPRASKSVPVRLTQVMFGIFIGLAFVMSVIAGRVQHGQAPALVKEDKTDAGSTLNGLDDLGIKPSATPGQASAQGAPAPETPPSPAPVPSSEGNAASGQPVGASGQAPVPSGDSPPTESQ